MAKNNGNLFLNRFRGTIGDQMVLRKGNDGRTIMCAKPTYNENRTYSPAQLAQQQAFREAVAYAKAKQGEEIYIALADKPGMSPYKVAMGDWLHKPRILEVDLSGWTNGNGNTIRVRAQDDVQVVRVKVTITDETGALLEEGEARDLDALWWEYNPSEAPGADKQVTVSAMDLPGHVAEWNEMLGHPRMP